MSDTSPLKIKDVLDPRRVQLHVEGGSKREILCALVSPVASTHRSINLDTLTETLLEREQTSTTAIADGIAIPHGRHSVGDQVVCCFGRNADGLDFDSIDGSPTKLFFVLISPESQPTLHLRWLAHIAVLLRDETLRNALLSGASADEILAALERGEKLLIQGAAGS
jgi:mannitol/fructose-specific phosphotransferase system IIA component (Ntr-type)